MTATAMPLAWVPVMILPTSASMAVPLGIVCAIAAMGLPRVARKSARSGTTFFHVPTVIILSETGLCNLPVADLTVSSLEDYHLSCKAHLSRARVQIFAGGRRSGVEKMSEMAMF